MSKLIIITVFKNDFQALKKTIASVQIQNVSRKSVVHLLIDGSSTDEAARVDFSKFKNLLYKRIVDDGVYDAMNQSILIAEKFAKADDYVTFLNAGDTLASCKVIKTFPWRQVSSEKPDIVYCNYIASDRGKQTFIHPHDPEIFRQYFEAGHITLDVLSKMPCHQATIYRFSYLRDHPYNSSYKVCADHHSFVSALMSGRAIKKINIDFCTYSLGGYSASKHTLLNAEWRKLFLSVAKSNEQIDHLFRNNASESTWHEIFKPPINLESQLFGIEGPFEEHNISAGSWCPGVVTMLVKTNSNTSNKLNIKCRNTHYGQIMSVICNGRLVAQDTLNNASFNLIDFDCVLPRAPMLFIKLKFSVVKKLAEDDLREASIFLESVSLAEMDVAG